MKAIHKIIQITVFVSIENLSQFSLTVIMSHVNFPLERFYHHLKTKNKVDALGQTQRDMISGDLSGDKNYSHPYFWAPFVLVGDWK
jgi:hypothetical protein